MLGRTALRALPRRAFSTSASRQTKVAVLGAGGTLHAQFCLVKMLKNALLDRIQEELANLCRFC